MAQVKTIRLPEEKEDRAQRRLAVFFLWSLVILAGLAWVMRGKIAEMLEEARLREIQLLEQKLAQKKNLPPKLMKKLEEEKKKAEEKKEDKKEGEKKPEQQKVDLQAKLSQTMNPTIKLGGPKLNVDVPQEIKLQIASTAMLPEQVHVKNIDLNFAMETSAKIDISSLDQSLSVEAADVVVAIPTKGVRTADILAQEAVPAVSLGGAGFEGSLGGGLGLGGEGGGGGIKLSSGGGGLAAAAPSVDVAVPKPAAKAVIAAPAEPVQVKGGGAIEVEGCIAGKVVRKVKPEYPLRARREGWQGVVVVQVVLSSNGTIKSLNLLKSSGYDILDRAAVEAIRGWQFSSNVPEGCEGKITMRFVLE
ncbi:energy transducer TonB [Candidatus Caldipriscus sp.]|nr:energy transducer TonB [Candidatus Caldipriscus sp.]